MSRVLPILFNADMVRAILDGRKTETRRVLKQPFEIHPNGYITKPRGNERLCPYEPPYQPGDTLYVRETFTDHWVPDEEDKPQLEYCYKADGIDIKAECLPGENNRWYPSIHMPKEAARIWLKVTDVRVERLQEITVQEIQREGLLPDGYISQYATLTEDLFSKFKTLWNSTIKKTDSDRYGWNANPWVWVIEFERCEKPEGWCT